MFELLRLHFFGGRNTGSTGWDPPVRRDSIHGHSEHLQPRVSNHPWVNEQHAMPRRFINQALSLFARGCRHAATLVDHLAISALRIAEMKNGIRNEFQDFNTEDGDIAAGLMYWEKGVLESVCQPGMNVLVIGCGSGRDLIALAERGCHMTGIDPAGAALLVGQRALQQRQLSATLVEGFFEDTPLVGTFDVVLFSYYAYALVPESRRRIDALHKAAALLRPGGSILISYRYSPSRAQGLLIKCSSVMGALCRSDWRLEDGDVVSVMREDVVFYRHYFGDGDLEKEAAAAGLRPTLRGGSNMERVVALQPVT